MKSFRDMCAERCEELGLVGDPIELWKEGFARRQKALGNCPPPPHVGSTIREVAASVDEEMNELLCWAKAGVKKYFGTIHAPGGEAYLRCGKKGALLEIPALPMAIIFSREEVAGWLRIMDALEAHAAVIGTWPPPPPTGKTIEELAKEAAEELEKLRAQSGQGTPLTPTTLPVSFPMSEEMARFFGARPSDDKIEAREPICTANIKCGEADVSCSRCRTANCPKEMKCWKCQGAL